MEPRPAGRSALATRSGVRLVLVAALALAASEAKGQAGSPAGPVPPQLLAARRAALISRLGTGVVVVRSAEEREDEAHAQDSGFRQDDDFFYLTGVEEAGSVLVGVAEGAGVGRWRLYVPERVPAQEQWTGARLGPGAEAVALTGVADVRAATRVAADVPELLAAGGEGGTLWVGGAAPRSCATRGAPCEDELVGPFVAAARGAVVPLGPQLAGLRLVKDADELRRMRQAVAITVAAQREAMLSAAPGQHEYEVEAVIEAAFRRRGAERVGFPSIVGSGPNSTVLHYDANRREMRSGDLVVMDVGAEYGYYTADVTRTIPISGTFTARQRAVYDLVLGAQQVAIDSVRPGTTLGRLEGIAREHMRANSGTTCGGQSCDRFFIHGLSHWLGMDVHDVGAYATTLQPGMVLTVEPGVYLPGESLGVRIEDDVLVTAAGHEVLSAGAPRQAAEVEQLMHASAASGAAKR